MPGHDIGWRQRLLIQCHRKLEAIGQGDTEAAWYLDICSICLINSCLLSSLEELPNISLINFFLIKSLIDACWRTSSLNSKLSLWPDTFVLFTGGSFLLGGVLFFPVESQGGLLSALGDSGGRWWPLVYSGLKGVFLLLIYLHHLIISFQVSIQTWSIQAFKSNFKIQ